MERQESEWSKSIRKTLQEDIFCSHFLCFSLINRQHSPA